MKLSCTLFVLAALLLAGCSSQPASEVKETPTGAPAHQSPVTPVPAGTRVGAPVPAWQMTLDIPENIPADKPVDMGVRIFDETGHPVTGGNVEVALRMLTMDMGENKSKLTERQPGVYAGKGAFSMAGSWEAIVTATKDNATFEKKFPVMVK